MKKSLIVISMLSVFGVVGCASVAVTEDAIVSSTAMALSADKSTFTITDRVDSGIKTTYNVKTNSGEKYSCYVTGTVTVVGRTVSDAICSKVGGSSGSTEKPADKPAKSDSSCNALLKAAGKC